MKNVTFSIPDELLKQSRDYAKKHGTTLNEFIRELLRRNVVGDAENPIDKILQYSDQIEIESQKWKWNRDEIYDQKVFS